MVCAIHFSALALYVDVVLILFSPVLYWILNEYKRRAGVNLEESHRFDGKFVGEDDHSSYTEIHHIYTDSTN